MSDFKTGARAFAVGRYQWDFYDLHDTVIFLTGDSHVRRKATMKQSDAEKDYRKPCTLCQTPRDVLVRCQIDDTGKWHFLCPGACWKRVSGGVVDGDKSEEHKYYRYGGMWKNKHEAVSAKIPKKVSQESKRKAEQMSVQDSHRGDDEEAGHEGTISLEIGEGS